MEKKNDHSQQQEEEKKELIKTIESIKLDETGVVSKLITQQYDPIVTIEKELRFKIDQETKEALKAEGDKADNY
jgi:hypothetical protein